MHIIFIFEQIYSLLITNNIFLLLLIFVYRIWYYEIVRLTAFILFLLNKLKIFLHRKKNYTIELAMLRLFLPRDQSLKQNKLEKSLTKNTLPRCATSLVFLYIQLNSYYLAHIVCTRSLTKTQYTTSKRELNIKPPNLKSTKSQQKRENKPTNRGKITNCHWN